ncbi:MAG TPA: beta-galactosidase trimerization domain-containing protein, partial [Puia sp.]|nr:beta-galactosidase trimerization domain-containing protein [Puia sp.]
ARLWMIEGLAGGLQLWWHMVSAYREDRRMLDNPTAIYSWEAANEAYLLHRRPIATVGVLWSQENYDLYGREHTEERIDLPWRGFTSALIRARIPYLPVHADDIDQTQLAVLILPDLALLSTEQVAALHRFADRGGSLIASGNTGLLDQHGETRADFALGDLFGVHLTGPRDLFATPKLEKLAGESWHTYLRVTAGARHPILKGFEKTDILPFGGLLDSLHVDAGAIVPLTFIPQFPVYPPEKAWMRIPATDIPGLVLREKPASEGAASQGPASQGPASERPASERRMTAKPARLAYLAADVDREYGRSNLPDHGDLLRNLVQWAAGGDLPLKVEGAGLIDCHLYEQPGRLILHLVNLTNENTWRQPLDELIPIGPLKIDVRLPEGISGRHLQLLVAGGAITAAVTEKADWPKAASEKPSPENWCHFVLPRILDHEVVIIT